MPPHYGHVFVLLGLLCCLSSLVEAFAPSNNAAVVHRLNRCASVLRAAEAAATATTTTTTTTLDGRKITGDLAPLNNFLLVKTAELIEKTEGGILLTGKAKIKKTEGKVVAVGPGRTHPDSGMVVEMPVKVGEGVVYGKYDGTEVKLNGVSHTLIRDDDILVKFTSDALTVDTVEVTRDNVLVKVDRKEAESESGLLIAKSAKSNNDKPSMGLVVKIGPGKMAANGNLIPLEVQVGDMVKFRDFLGNEVEIDKEEYSVIKMTDILAKF
jgi:chaperonin GroES